MIVFLLVNPLCQQEHNGNKINLGIKASRFITYHVNVIKLK